jgi:hypothetical protein
MELGQIRHPSHDLVLKGRMCVNLRTEVWVFHFCILVNKIGTIEVVGGCSGRLGQDSSKQG